MIGNGNIGLYDIEENFLFYFENIENVDDVIVVDLNFGIYYV